MAPLAPGNDFALACAITFARMYADLPEGPLEVHVMHDARRKLRVDAEPELEERRPRRLAG